MVPAALAVAVVAGCGDDKPSTTSDTTTATTGGAATSTPTSADPTDTGGVPDCSMYAAEPACAAEAGCFWFTEGDVCLVDCRDITDASTCDMQEFCQWVEGQCALLLV